jgi:hypothetical protein
MAFASEFEYEDDLELLEYELELLESDIGKKPPNLTDLNFPWDKKDFYARASGFHSQDYHPERDKKFDARRQHESALNAIAIGIINRTASGKCVDVFVSGYADPYTESKKAIKISQDRADSFRWRIELRILEIMGNKADEIVRRTIFYKPDGKGAKALWPKSPNTKLNRVQNRRVEVFVSMREACPKP